MAGSLALAARPDRGRGTRWARRVLLVAAAAGIAAVVAVAALATVGYLDSVRGLDRGATPNSATVAASSPGRVVVYYEGGGERALESLGITVTGPGGTTVPVYPFPYELRYSIHNVAGMAVAAFDAPQPGSYLVRATPGIDGRLAAGRDVGPATVAMVVAVIAAVVVIGGAAVIGVAVLLIPTVRRPARRSAEAGRMA